MGCGSSSEIKEEEKRNLVNELREKLPENTKKSLEYYLQTHQKILSLTRDIHSKFKDDFYNFLENYLPENVFFERYESVLKLKELTREDLIDYGFELDLIRKMVKTYIDYGVHDFVISNCGDDVSDKYKDEINNLFKINGSIYPNFQRGYILYAWEEEDQSLDEVLRTIRLLKYNESYNKMELFNLHVRLDQTPVELLDEIIEIIPLNFNLMTFVITIDVFGYNEAEEKTRVFFDKISLIFEKVVIHPNIKAFALVIANNENYNFPELFYQSLFRIVQSKPLLGYVMYDVTLDDNTGTNFSKALAFNSNLKFFIINFRNSVDGFIDIFIKSIEKLKNLHTINIIGGQIKEEKLNELYSSLEHVKVIHHQKENE